MTMTVTNATNFDIYFGPLHLPAGVGQTLLVDDTSATSLYLLDDAVADALNNAVASGQATASGYALPFPRPTGDPQLLHGLGAPEGSVYAPPGSLFMRRDTSGAGNSLYAKTTPRTASTGWHTFGVPVVSPMSGGPPTAPLDGDVWIATGVDTNGTRWAFQYNAASASTYKWEFIGGPDVLSEVLTDESRSGTTAFGDLATVGPSFTLARAGDYRFSWGAITYQSGTLANVDVGLSINGSGPSSPTDSVTAFGFAAGSYSGNISRRRTYDSNPAASVAKLLYAVENAGCTGHFLQRWLSVTPVRIA